VGLTSIRKVYVNKSPYSAEFGGLEGGVKYFEEGLRWRLSWHSHLLTRNPNLDARIPSPGSTPPSTEIAESDLMGLRKEGALFLQKAGITSAMKCHSPCGYVYRFAGIENVGLQSQYPAFSEGSILICRRNTL